VAHGPDVHVVATFPVDGAGTECDGNSPADCGVPVDAPIELRFDRFLLPNTVAGHSLGVYSGRSFARLEPTYDPVERVVVFRPGYGSTLVPGVLYEVDLPSPDTDPHGYGFRAFDGASLAPTASFSFRTARAPVVRKVAAAPPPTCAQALGVFASGRCLACHGPNADAPTGLALHSGAALDATAINRVAHEVDTAETAGSPLGDPPRFGTALPIIDPGSPATSYLIYKLLVSGANFGSTGAACDSDYAVASPSAGCLAPAADERRRLGDWFVSGDPMPPPPSSLAAGIQDLRLLRDFIAAGADTSDCQ
jgi:hypothetical protein